jgi:AcrR family transcriptional regulator
VRRDACGGLIGNLDDAAGLAHPPAMTSAISRNRSTTLAIIESAERLFGDYGIEGVSIRQIGLEAKVGNKSAISYHFGDRADLVRAIWADRLPVLDKMRRAILDEIVAQGQTRDRHAVIRALVLPNYQLVDGAGVHRYAAFLRSVMRWREGRILRAQEMDASPASRAALDMLWSLGADIPRGVLGWRLAYASTTFLDMVVDHDHDLREGRLVLGESAFLHEGIDMVVAHCFRPLAE